MDLAREEPEERLYDRDAVLGRDVSSVFPTEISMKAAAESASAAEAIGGRNFITEKELEAIKAERGETTEAVIPEKPLAQVLADAKQAKEDAFQAQWRQMKTGKNRPLDADELEFYDTLRQQAEHADEAWKSEQERELDVYQQAVRAQAEARSAGTAAAASPAQPKPLPAKAQEPQQQKPKPAPRRPMLSVVRKKPSAGAAAAAAADAPPPKRQHTSGAAADGADSVTEAQQRRQQSDAAAEQGGSGNSDGGGGLAGLLGGYTSGSDSD